MVRSWTFVVVALLLLGGGTLPPGAAAQGTAEERPEDARVEDEAGDVVLRTPAGNQPPPSDMYDHVDIVAAWIGAETRDAVEVGVTMQRLQPSAQPAQGFTQSFVWVYFTFDDHQYRVASLAGGCPTGALQRFDVGPEFYRTSSCLEREVDAGQNTVRWQIPKAILTNENHVPLRYGDRLLGLYAEAIATVVPGTQFLSFLPVGFAGVTAYDRAPNSGVGPVFRSVLGTSGVGDIHLTAEEPIRVSNGEATTIVYQVHLVNQAETEDAVLLSVEDVRTPRGVTFDIRVPEKLLVHPHSSVRFPVILSMGFSHQHGAYGHFTVKAESTAAPGQWSTTDLGVFWTDIPQPAGHHNALWLHSAPSSGDNPFEQAFGTAYQFYRVWMNALMPGEDPDPATTDEDVPAYFNQGLFPGQGSGENVAWWMFPLSPALQIGLNFDLARSASEDSVFTTEIRPAVPASVARLETLLRYCDPTATEGGQGGGQGGGGGACPGRWFVLAQGVSESTSLQANQPKRFDVPLVVDAMADLIPYRKGAQLQLIVRLVTDTPQNANLPAPTPRLVVRSSELLLPLFEYHDPVDQAFQDVGTLRLVALSDFEKFVNPGRTTYFHFQVTNRGDRAQDLAVGLEGVNKGWVRIVQGEALALAPGQTGNVTVEVVVPVGTQEGERAELFLVAQSTEDPNVVAVARLRASVVNVATRDVADEAGTLHLEGDVESPALAPLMAVAAAAAAALVVRRRRSGV